MGTHHAGVNMPNNTRTRATRTYQIHRRLAEAHKFYTDEGDMGIVAGLEIAWSEIKHEDDPQLNEEWVIPTTIKHGTQSAYINYGCRCPRCTEANTLIVRAWRKKQK